METANITITDDFYSLENVIVDSMKNHSQGFPISTGFKELDCQIGGWHPGEFVLLAGRPGMGSTGLGISIAKQYLRLSDKSMAFFTLEMSKEIIAKRMIISEFGKDYERCLVTGEITYRSILDSLSLTSHRVLIDDTPAIEVKDIYNKCKAYKSKYDIGLIVIDYLLLISCGEIKERSKRVDKVLWMLRRTAKELGIIVVVMTQLNRTAESRKNHEILLSDLIESETIEPVVDTVIFVYRDKYYNKHTKKGDISELIIGKQRNGYPGHVEVMWDPDKLIFSEIHQNENYQ